MNMNDLILKNERSGGRFFSPENMRFAHSRTGYRVETSTVGTFKLYVFVTSERESLLYSEPSERRYTVRGMTESGAVVHVGCAYQQFSSRDQAWRWWTKHRAEFEGWIAQGLGDNPPNAYAFEMDSIPRKALIAVLIEAERDHA